MISELREVENLDPRLLSILTGSRSCRIDNTRDATTYPTITPTNSHPANTNAKLIISLRRDEVSWLKATYSVLTTVLQNDWPRVDQPPPIPKMIRMSKKIRDKESRDRMLIEANPSRMKNKPVKRLVANMNNMSV